EVFQLHRCFADKRGVWGDLAQAPEDVVSEGGPLLFEVSLGQTIAFRIVSETFELLSWQGAADPTPQGVVAVSGRAVEGVGLFEQVAGPVVFVGGDPKVRVCYLAKPSESIVFEAGRPVEFV